MEPAAQALLAQGIQSYKGQQGISYKIARSTDGKEAPSTTIILYSRPDKFNISEQQVNSAETKTTTLSDGSNIYLVLDKEYYKLPVSPQIIPTIMSNGGTAGQIIATMMEGHNPVKAIQDIYSNPIFKNFKSSNVVAMEPRVVDGDYLSGIQYSFSVSLPSGEKQSLSLHHQITAWFGGTPLLLRRVQTRITSRVRNITITEKIVDQQLAPTFTPDTFKFNDKGLKPMSTTNNSTYWDPRLKVGTTPFAFSAPDLKGQSHSPQKYKGKVLLLDFWATWCGPCVASLPELKGAYDKYHKQGLEVVGISLDTDKNALTSFIKARQMEWPQIYAGQGKSTIPNVYGVKAIPFMLIIGKDGKIAAVNPRGKIDDAVKAALAKS